MKLRNIASVAMLWAISTAGGASAATVTGSAAPNAPIPTTGTLGNVTFDIVIGISGEITDVTVRLNISHSQVGDLRISLSNDDYSITRDLVYRVGASGGTGGGDNSNLLGVYSFNDNFAGNIWTAAGNVNGTNTTVATGNYRATTIDGVNVALTAGGFGGEDTLGTWHLTINDLINNNAGTLTSWELEFATNDTPPPTVPEPSAYMLFGLGLGGLAALRRKR
jgi:subtilisin-like proprotein convertase family protein